MSVIKESGILSAEAFEKQRQDTLRILAQGVAAAGNAPVIHQPALEHRIGFGNVINRKFLAEGAILLPFADDLTQQLIIGTIRAHHVTLAVCDELGREQLAQQVYRYGIVNHQKQLLIHKVELLDGGKVRIHAFGQLIIFFVKEIRKRAEQRGLAVKIVVEGASRGAGGLDDLLDGGVVVALLVK